MFKIIETLKALMPREAQRAFGHGVEITANKAGSLTVKRLDAPQEKAA